MPSETYFDEHECPFCKKETLCEFYNAGHERDGSNDKITCTICKSYQSGLTGDWYTADGNEIEED